MRFARIALVIIAVICFGVALSYPIRYRLAQKSNDSNMQALSDMRAKVLASSDATAAPRPAAKVTEAVEAEPTDAAKDTAVAGPIGAAATPDATGAIEPPDEAGEDGAPEGTALPEATVSADVSDTATEPPADETPVETELPVGATETPVAASVSDGETETPAVEAPIGGNTPNGKESPADVAPVVTNVPAGTPDAPTETGTVEPSVSADVPGDGDTPPPAAPTPGDAVTATEAPIPVSASTTFEQQADVDLRDEDVVNPSFPDEPVHDQETPSTDEPTPVPTPTPTPGIMDLILDYEPWPTMVPIVIKATPTPDPDATPTPAPTFDIAGFTGALPYSLKEKVTLDEDAILPELKEIYDLNHDLVGWITIPDTLIDYPVVQRPDDSEFYLDHDFYGEENQNGQIILDPLCDPYTPSYNLVISGHHMKNGSMFGKLPEYRAESYWRKHMFLEFDTLMERKQYVVFAAFYSADYDEDETGFRYNANVRYRMDADPWLSEIRENQLYDTGIDVKFGDEFITLTTCNRARHRNGRFVVVCRRIREGETFE